MRLKDGRKVEEVKVEETEGDEMCGGRVGR
jgi:hypothetical protein